MITAIALPTTATAITAGSAMSDSVWQAWCLGTYRDNVAISELAAAVYAERPDLAVRHTDSASAAVHGNVVTQLEFIAG